MVFAQHSASVREHAGLSASHHCNLKGERATKFVSPRPHTVLVLLMLPAFSVSWSWPGVAKETKETDEEKPIKADELTGARRERPEHFNQAEV